MLGQPNIIFVEIIVLMISLTESAICYSHAKVETVAKSSKCWTILMLNLAFFFLITHYSLKHIEHFLRSILAMNQPWRNQQREIYRLVKRLQYYIALSLDFSIEVYWQWETYSGSFFSPCNERKDKIRVPVRNRTSDLWITRCEAQSLTNRDSKVS